MSEQSLTIRDGRTGKSYTLPIENGTVRAMDLRQIKTDADDFGLMVYDPALMNTASTKSVNISTSFNPRSDRFHRDTDYGETGK